MKKSVKTLCIVTAIISILLGVVFLLQGMFLMFNIAGYRDIFVNLIREMGLASNTNEIDLQVNMAIFDSVIGILLNTYAAGVYFKIFKSNNIILGSSRILLNIGILQCFFIISILPGVLAIIIAAIIKREEQIIIQRPRQAYSAQDDLVDRITNLKARKESGNITEEEYKKLLDAMIEQSVIDNPDSRWAKSESLQSKIANLKAESKNEESEDNE